MRRERERWREDMVVDGRCMDTVECGVGQQLARSTYCVHIQRTVLAQLESRGRLRLGAAWQDAGPTSDMTERHGAGPEAALSVSNWQLELDQRALKLKLKAVFTYQVPIHAVSESSTLDGRKAKSANGFFPWRTCTPRRVLLRVSVAVAHLPGSS